MRGFVAILAGRDSNEACKRTAHDISTIKSAAGSNLLKTLVGTFQLNARGLYMSYSAPLLLPCSTEPASTFAVRVAIGVKKNVNRPI